MKRPLFTATILALALFLNVNTSFAEDTSPVPDTLVYYNSWPGDHESPLHKSLKMSPTKPMNIYKFKNTNSQVVKTIQAGDLVTLITADYHAFPSQSPVVVLEEKNGLNPGDTFYLMSYIGGGDCLAWYDNNVIYVPAEGIEGVKYYKEQRLDVPMWSKLTGQLPQRPILWLYVSVEGNQYGWIKHDTYQDWKRFGYTIFLR